MINQRCKDCYYGNVCPDSVVCDNFIPVTDEAEDIMLGEIIERGREEFHADWNTYISED